MLYIHISVDMNDTFRKEQCRAEGRRRRKKKMMRDDRYVHLLAGST
jgi:hypothetical protein